MITPSLKHLVLDASAVSVLCAQGHQSEVSDVLNFAQGKGIRVWFYAGEYADLVRWSNVEKRCGSDSEGTSALSPLRELEQYSLAPNGCLRLQVICRITMIPIRSRAH